MTRYRIERIALTPETKAELDDLDSQCFPYDDLYPKGDAQDWWVARDDHGVPVAFAGSVFWDEDNCIYLCRAGVIERARGNGLQRRLIRVRCNHGRKLGCEGAYTYTALHNTQSANNLIACGFKLWEPDWYFGGQNRAYWWKGFQTK